MAHRVSAASLHAARIVLKNYTLVVKPPESLPSGRLDKLEPNEKCVAILIDYATNIFQVVLLRPELRYWQKRLWARTATAPQLMGYFQKLITALEMVPQDTDLKTTITLESPAEFGGKPVMHTISKAAKEASRFIFYYYEVTSKRKELVEEESLFRINVAKLIDICLEIERAMKALPLLKHWREELKAGRATEVEIRRCFREAGVFLTYMPNFGSTEEETKLL